MKRKITKKFYILKYLGKKQLIAASDYNITTKKDNEYVPQQVSYNSNTLCLKITFDIVY